MSSKYSGSNLQRVGWWVNCSCYGAVKLHGHGMKEVERLLEHRLC